MGKIRTADDGLGFPAAGTKVRYLKGNRGGYVANKYEDKVVYVCGCPASSSGIVVFDEPGQYHGDFCYEWEEISPLDSLTEEDKKELRELALAAAKKRGYCNETEKILRDLGLVDTVDKTIKVKIPKGAKITLLVDGKEVEYSDW